MQIIIFRLMKTMG